MRSKSVEQKETANSGPASESKTSEVGHSVGSITSVAWSSASAAAAGSASDSSEPNASQISNSRSSSHVVNATNATNARDSAAHAERERDESLDHEILALLGSGKKDRAWRLFIQQYQPKLYNLCFRMLGNYDDAIDALQEAYVQIDRSIPRFRGDSSLYTWAYRVVLNVILGYRKKRSHLQSHHTGQELPEISRPEDDPDKMCEEKYRKHLLHEALQKLPQHQRCPLIMHDLDGFSFAEIAESIGSTAGAVKVKVFRARQTLEKLLRQGQKVPGFENVGRFDGALLKQLIG